MHCGSFRQNATSKEKHIQILIFKDALCEIAKLWSNQVEENQLLKVLSHDLQVSLNNE